jgi:DNA polymerase-3 subunit epsilon
MVPLRGGTVRWGERFYRLVRPPSFAGLDDAAITVHHIVPEELHRAPPPAEVLPEVAVRLEGAVLLLHHAPLDLAFLRRGFAAHGLAWPRPPVVDTRLLIARVEDRLRRIEPHPRPLPRALSEIRDQLGLPRYATHHALTDALATAELFLALRARLGAERLRQLTR